MYGWVIDVSERGGFESLWLAEADRHAAPDGSTPLDKFRDVTVMIAVRRGMPMFCPPIERHPISHNVNRLPAQKRVTR